MTPTEIESLAQELMAAQRTGNMVAIPTSSRPGFDLDAAYTVEAALKRFHEAEGHRAIGRKVGYANKAMWRMLKLETLVWAHMYDDTVHYSDGNSAELTIPHPRSLKVEPEIVFGMKDAITTRNGQDNDANTALAATEWLAIGFEIIDCPFAEWKFQPSDFVASFGLHAGLVVGKRVPVGIADIAALAEELPRCKVRVSKNDGFVEEGSGRNALKSPALCLAELSSAIGRRCPDQPLRGGEIVSSGTLSAGHLAGPGDLWNVEVEGLSLLTASKGKKLTLRLG